MFEATINKKDFCGRLPKTNVRLLKVSQNVKTKWVSFDKLAKQQRADFRSIKSLIQNHGECYTRSKHMHTRVREKQKIVHNMPTYYMDRTIYVLDISK